MKILQIYEDYKIIPTLQIHMLRVGAVAFIICDIFQKPIDKEAVVSACLLHDMGNIIKFKLGFIPQAIRKEGLDYWQNIQNDFKARYGTNEKEAACKIAGELGVSEKVIDIIKATGFPKAADVAASDSYEKKIGCYSDQRVVPFGIASLEERMNEGIKRFVANKDAEFDSEVHERMSASLKTIEKQIFDKCSEGPEFITNERTYLILKKLREFEITSIKP